MEIIKKQRGPSDHMSHVPLLPDDVIFYEIFPRLPVNSLRRFRRVSTFSRRLTSDRRFLAAVHSLGPRRYSLSFSTPSCWQLALFSLDEVGPTAAVATADAPVRANPSSAQACIFSKVVNGLTCRVNAECKVVVSNRATGEEIQLPSLVMLLTQLDRVRFYFCHDPEADMYKVLQTTSILAYTNHVAIAQIMSYSVFTLGSNTLSVWRSFYPQGQLYQMGNSKSVSIDGVLYITRFSTSNEEEEGVIAAFIIRTECFHAVNYPNGLSPSRYGHCQPIEVKGALALADVGDNSGCYVRLWVKEKLGFGLSDGDESNWIERRIELDPRWEIIFRMKLNYGFSTNRDGEIVMGVARLWTDYGCWIFVYNLERGEWRRIEIVGLGRLMILGEFCVEEFVETPMLLSET